MQEAHTQLVDWDEDRLPDLLLLAAVATAAAAAALLILSSLLLLLLLPLSLLLFNREAAVHNTTKHNKTQHTPQSEQRTIKGIVKSTRMLLRGL